MTYLYVSLQSIISKNQLKCQKNFPVIERMSRSSPLPPLFKISNLKIGKFENRTLIKAESTVLYKGRQVRFVSNITWPATESLKVPVHKYDK